MVGPWCLHECYKNTPPIVISHFFVHFCQLRPRYVQENMLILTLVIEPFVNSNKQTLKMSNNSLLCTTNTINFFIFEFVHTSLFRTFTNTYKPLLHIFIPQISLTFFCSFSLDNPILCLKYQFWKACQRWFVVKSDRYIW